MAYTKHTWQSGETITDEALNNIEKAPMREIRISEPFINILSNSNA